MTSIDPTSRLLAYLRQQAQEWRKQLPARSAAAAPDAPRAEPMQVAAQAIASLDPADPKARRQAFRAFLEAVLSREFDTPAGEPGFAALVDRVHATMEGDVQLKAAMDEAGELLLKRFRPA